MAKKSTKKAASAPATHAAPAAAADTTTAADLTKTQRARRTLHVGRQVLSVSIDMRTYVPGNTKDEADLLKILTPEQAATLTEHGAFESADADTD